MRKSGRGRGSNNLPSSSSRRQKLGEPVLTTTSQIVRVLEAESQEEYEFEYEFSQQDILGSFDVNQTLATEEGVVQHIIIPNQDHPEPPSSTVANVIGDIPAVPSDVDDSNEVADTVLDDLDVDEDFFLRTSNSSDSDTTDTEENSASSSTGRKKTLIEKIRHNHAAGRKKGGRSKDRIWLNYKVLTVSPKRKDATCLKCGSTIQWAKVNRLQLHEKKCKIALASDRPLNKSAQALPMASAFSPMYSKASKAKKWDMPSAVERMKQEKDNIDMQVGRFVYGSNVPFQIVESPEFVKLMKLLKPHYDLPSKEIVGTSLLEKVYQETTKTENLNLNGKLVTLMQDGWTATQSTPVVSHCLNFDCNRIQFVNAINCKAEKKTSEYCFKLLSDTKEMIENQYGCTVIAVVTDNTNGMILMRSLAKLHYQDLFTYGCHTHLLNLVGKSITDKNVLDQVASVQHFFKDHTYTRETLKELKGLTPVLPCQTRWNSQYDCFENFIKNHSLYTEISKHERSDTPPEIMDLVMKYDFFKSVEKTMENTHPLAEAIVKLQHDRASIAYAVKLWIRIIDKCVIPTNYKKRFDEILDLALTDVACAAYILHPKYKGKNLPNKYVDRGHKFLEGKHPAYSVAAMKLSLKDDTFYLPLFLNDSILKGKFRVEAHQWWKQIGMQMKDKLPQGLAFLGEKLMMLPASSSGIERCFSTMGNIMTDVKNSLGVEKAAKLCMIYRNLNKK